MQQENKPNGYKTLATAFKRIKSEGFHLLNQEPCEQIWQYIKNRYKNYQFNSIKELKN